MVPPKVMAFVSLLCFLSVLEAAYPEGSCGEVGGGALCPGGMCCSNAGYCGYTDDYCAPGHCQSQCPESSPPPPPPPPPPPGPPPSGKDISAIFPSSMFEAMFLHRNTFYKYDDFITATKAFPAFASSDDKAIQLKEIAAFFGQTSQETSGSWETAPDRYFWGYVFVEELAGGVHCQDSIQWPCAPGKEYFGRGPIQLSYNYNYGPCGVALGLDLLHNPELVSSDGVVSFKSALWFWMTAQYNKPSCHDVITGQWTPSSADVTAGRLSGYGVLTNIINGGLECGPGASADGKRQSQNRIGYYENYCGLLQVDPGPNLDCDSQTPFGVGALVDTM